MSIVQICNSCGKRLRVDEKYIGRVVTCPRCQTRLTVTAPKEGVSATVGVGAVEPEKKQVSSHSPASEEDGPLLSPRKHAEIHDLIDMTAMVDIVFFLLIFFLVTSFQEIDSAIDMPIPKGGGRSGASATPPPPEQLQVKVEIDRNDQIKVDGIEVHGPDDLFLRLREIRSGASRPESMLVIGSAEATHGTLVTVLDSGQEAGIEKLQLAVREDSKSTAATAAK